MRGGLKDERGDHEWRAVLSLAERREGESFSLEGSEEKIRVKSRRFYGQKPDLRIFSLVLEKENFELLFLICKKTLLIFAAKSSRTHIIGLYLIKNCRILSIINFI